MLPGKLKLPNSVLFCAGKGITMSICFQTGISKYLMLLPLHIGKAELHVPLPWQVIVSAPESEYPLLHTNFTVVPSWYSLPLFGGTVESIRPFVGAIGAEQVIDAIKM